ncbi:Conserved_hypothetical protein [Hexamita inflata]|uniref:DUF2157 domain-containing protein n=1 Tax=Hexamita inflata TaxID=28002 RepID=A0ABP1IZ48_9EUKA
MQLLIISQAHQSNYTIKQTLLKELLQSGDINQTQHDSLIDEYIKPYLQKQHVNTLSKFIKTIAFGFLFILIYVFFMAIVAQAFHVLPKLIVLLTILAITGLVNPSIFSKSDSTWIAILCAFTTPIIVIAFCGVYKKQLEPIVRILLLPFLPRGIVLNVLFVVYFAALAIIYKSQLIGFAAVVALSSLTSFSVFYMPGMLVLSFKDYMLPFLVFGHFLVLSAYSALILTNHFVEYITVFQTGLEYYVSIALATGLHVGSSPLYRNKANTISYALFFILLSTLTLLLNIFTQIKVPGSVLCGFCVFTIIEWLGFLALKRGTTFCCVVLAASLFGLAVGIDKCQGLIQFK